jgi:MipA family protein
MPTKNACALIEGRHHLLQRQKGKKMRNLPVLNTFGTVTMAMLLVAGITALPAFSQDSVTGSWTLGVAATPDYEGSEDIQAVPLLGFRFERGGRSLELQGTTLRANIVTGRGFEAGPVLNYRLGRDSVDNVAVAALPDVDATAELGAFVALGLPLASGEIRFSGELLADVGGVHDGAIGTVAATYRTALTERLRVGVGASMTAVSDSYAVTYFSVSPLGAAASGLAAYEASGGLKDAGIDLSLNYALSERTSITGFASYRRLLGDFADSPIVTSGSEDQVTLGLAISRSF